MPLWLRLQEPLGEMNRMKTPIVDFISSYLNNKNILRLHMPGHKGVKLTGPESYDITEIAGADSLYEANGIIRKSEDYASEIFGARTFYSTEGSSLCIRAMLYLALANAGQKQQGKKPWVLAGRNAHKTFLSAVGLLDLDVKWLFPKEEESYLSCKLTDAIVERALMEAQTKPIAVYVTSPDYLGNIVDIAAIAKVCHKHGVLLLVDNAHGAYLKFLTASMHPMDLGADMCCDSAHKTLPALTGAAYLHIAKHLPEEYALQAKQALGLFGSTSPSYLILQSLDAVNAYLAGTYRKELSEFVLRLDALKKELSVAGYELVGDETIKLTVATKSYGYTGNALAQLLEKESIICEFADPDYLVLMLTPQIEDIEIERLKKVLLAIPKRNAIKELAPRFQAQERCLSVREAMLAESEQIAVEESEGRILSNTTVGCPPAVPIVVCGEKMDAHAIECFQYYGIDSCWVVKEW